jgi:hypothetical protein
VGILIAILSLIGSIIGSNLMVERYKRKTKLEDDRNLADDEITKEEIVGQRELARDIREDAKEIRQIERVLREERTADKITIAIQKLQLEEKDKQLGERDKRIAALEAELKRKGGK